MLDMTIKQEDTQQAVKDVQSDIAYQARLMHQFADALDILSEEWAGAPDFDELLESIGRGRLGVDLKDHMRRWYGDRVLGVNVDELRDKAQACVDLLADYREQEA